MGEIQIIEHNGFRVVTSQQIAEAYGTESKQVSQGFNRNKGKFQEGKHYFILQGEELKVFLQSALSRLQISSKPYVCVITCNMQKEQLNGMLDLLFHADIITQGQWGSERERVEDMFDARKICGHYQEPGGICPCADFRD